ncbi:WD repeat-containing protein 5 homolog [Dictyostelium discoideum] [Rhizoctonia solani]|uniref:WD repeat-containing protein 5 homolog [Dictyostelium discoideum] n=1 Tax=Rhizoctonia solani TaxID=456999 RepID=A0A0K6GFF1_9AGAM|nr:WD repeat-containing protein 5 homolog [Dictyostelium discoideum] [Rhizoctonia solani]
MIVHKGHTGGIWSVAYSPDGKSVASGSWDNTIRIWHADSSSPIGKPLTGHSDWIRSIAYSPLGNTIASASYDKSIRIWDVNTRQQLGEPLQLAGNNAFFSVAFSPDAKLIASGCGRGLFSFNSSENTVQLWDVQNRTPALGPFSGHTDMVRSVEFSPDGTCVASGSNDMTIRIWDIESGTTITGPLEGHTGRVRSIAYSPEGSQIISCSLDHTLRLWDVRTGGMIGNPFEGHIGYVYSVAFSPRGTYIVSGGQDDTVRLWDIRTGHQVNDSFQEHTSEVFSVAFSPSGRYIASGSGDRKVIIRELSSDYPDSPGLRIVTSHFSSQMEVFECLIAAGCIDLSSQMNTRQDTATIAARGGLGDIWKGQLYSGANVAIKCWRHNILEQADYKSLKRAARELYNWSRLDHPNIHRLQGVILFRDFYLGMVSEWMDNGNLREYLEKYPDADRYQLCIHVALGLEYMHNHSAIHGDVKAMNVLVSSDGVAKLSDFGSSIMSEISSLVFSESSDSLVGAARWMVIYTQMDNPSTTFPGHRLQTMLEIFTGEVPYPECRQDFAIIIKVQKGVPPARPLKRLKDNEQGNMMWQLLLDCWNRDPNARPSSKKVVDTLVSRIYKA